MLLDFILLYPNAFGIAFGLIVGVLISFLLSYPALYVKSGKYDPKDDPYRKNHL